MTPEVRSMRAALTPKMEGRKVMNEGGKNIIDDFGLKPRFTNRAHDYIPFGGPDSLAKPKATSNEL